MIDRQLESGLIAPVLTQPRKALRMEASERMAGSVPVWGETQTMHQQAEQRLALAGSAQTQENKSFQAVLAYQEQEPRETGTPPPVEEFGVGDLVDMVNPLQHIPVIGHLYRKVTGDEVTSIAQIIGGALYGGPAGAASGLVNAIVREETGKDIAGNALAMVADGQAPALRGASPNHADNPERRLDQAAQQLDKNDADGLPVSLLGFTDSPVRRMERIAAQNSELSEPPPLTLLDLMRRRQTA